MPHVRRFWIEYEDGSRSRLRCLGGGGMLTLLRQLLQDEKLRRPFVHSHSIGRPRSKRTDFCNREAGAVLVSARW